MTGNAAALYAGPAVSLSFVLAGFAAAFAGMVLNLDFSVTFVFQGLCYSELASMIPCSGSAYSYSYATMGELVGWIIGWDLILEYLAGSAGKIMIRNALQGY